MVARIVQLAILGTAVWVVRRRVILIQFQQFEQGVNDSIVRQGGEIKAAAFESVFE